MEDVKKLTPEQYWKWRYQIEKMWHEEMKLKQKRTFSALMEKDIEIDKLKLQIYKRQITQQETLWSESKSEYEQMKIELENDLGMSLNKCVIDDLNYEVKPLDELDEVNE